MNCPICELKENLEMVGDSHYICHTKTCHPHGKPTEHFQNATKRNFTKRNTLNPKYLNFNKKYRRVLSPPIFIQHRHLKYHRDNDSIGIADNVLCVHPTFQQDQQSLYQEGRQYSMGIPAGLVYYSLEGICFY